MRVFRLRDQLARQYFSCVRSFVQIRDKRIGEEKFNSDYRTKRGILEIYDAMHEAIKTGTPYQTRLDAPPADPRCCHPPKEHAVR